MTFREGTRETWSPEPIESEAVAASPEADGAVEPGVSSAVTLPVNLPGLLRDLEDTYIQAALAQTRSNKKEAAKLLGLGRTTLVEKLRRRNMVRTGP